jgi:hypothetical protein
MMGYWTLSITMEYQNGWLLTEFAEETLHDGALSKPTISNRHTQNHTFPGKIKQRVRSEK